MKERLKDGGYLGVDPDLHHTAMALVLVADGQPELMGYSVQSISRKAVGLEAVQKSIAGMLEAICNTVGQEDSFSAVVESQEVISSARRRANPQDIVHLAQVAGGAMGALDSYGPCGRTILVPPNVWKGSVPKYIHQARICGRMGWGSQVRGSGDRRYCVPVAERKTPPTMKAGEWRHLLDAAGMALWAANNS